MFKPLLLLIASVLPLMAAIEEEAAIALATTNAAWREQVREFAGGYAATIRTADAGTGLTVGEQFLVVVVSTEQRLGVVGLQLPTGVLSCEIVTGQAGTIGFHNQTQLPFLNGSLTRLSGQSGLRLTLALATSISEVRSITADLELLPPPSP